jgi:hypothetical protein
MTYRRKSWLTIARRTLKIISNAHDESKLQEPEKSIFDEYTPIGLGVNG